MAEPASSSSSNTSSANAGGRPGSWRKISLPLPHLFPHLTINFHRSASMTRRTSSPAPPPHPIVPNQPQQPSQQPPPPSRTGSKSGGRDWRLRRQKTYDSPGCLVAHSRSAISIQQQVKKNAHLHDFLLTSPSSPFSLSMKSALIEALERTAPQPINVVKSRNICFYFFCVSYVTACRRMSNLKRDVLMMN